MHMPPPDCQKCPRLSAFRAENKTKFPDKFNAPVPSFGSLEAEILIVGLAPGLKGANFTGRPFTGDYAGDVLYPALLKYNLARGVYKAEPNDGFELINCRVTNAVRCVPPQNKPVGAEINTCRDFLIEEIAAMPNLKAILSLGRISHESVLRAFGFKQAAYKFVHGAQHALNSKITLHNTYHTSRYNVNTGRLTPQMFDVVIQTLIKA